MKTFSQLLLDSGVSKSELAKALNVDKAQVTRWKKWGMPIPQARLVDVAKVTGIPLAELQQPFRSHDGNVIERGVA